jgi:uncharacterized protein (TIGR02266 family)
MQEKAGKQSNDPSYPTRSASVDQYSGARSGVAPTITGCPEEEADAEITLRSISSDVLEPELARIRASIAEREQEIALLKERLALLEGELKTRSEALRPSGSVEKDTSPQVNVAVLENTYPTLQRVAVAYSSSSLPPPHLLDSLAPSQRRTSRRCCELQLEFTEDTHFYAGLTQDISQGGVFIATYRLLPVGRRLELDFDLPNGTHVKASGEVRWLRESTAPSVRPGMGVAFLDLPTESLHAIGEYCRERPPLYMEV